MSRMGHVRQSIGPSPTDGLPSGADTRCSAEHSREVLNSDRLVPMLTASQCLDGLDQLGLSGEPAHCSWLTTLSVSSSYRFRTGGADTCIPKPVTADLGRPKLYTAFRQLAGGTLVPVPIASVDEDYLTASRQNHIRSPGQIFAMKSKPESHRMQHPADDKLGCCVLSAYARHQRAPLFDRQLIDHFAAQTERRLAAMLNKTCGGKGCKRKSDLRPLGPLG